jgi:hypothetical protein
MRLAFIDKDERGLDGTALALSSRKSATAKTRQGADAMMAFLAHVNGIASYSD